MSDAFTLDSLEAVHKATSPGSWDFSLESGFEGTFYEVIGKEGKIGEVYDLDDAKGIVIMHDVFPQLIRDVYKGEKRTHDLEAQVSELRRALAEKDALLRHLASLIITREEYFGRCYTVENVLELAKESMNGKPVA